MARCLINPVIKINTRVQISQASIQQAQLFVDVGGGVTNPQNSKIPSLTADGIYRVLQIEVNGDTRGTPWYMDLNCFSPTLAGFVPKDALFAAGNPQGPTPAYQGTE